MSVKHRAYGHSVATLLNPRGVTISYKYSLGEQGSSGSIVSDYGLDDRVIGVRYPAEAKDFSSSLCPDRLWGPPSLLYNGYRGPFHGGKSADGA
jgi:hypothetical protein